MNIVETQQCDDNPEVENQNTDARGYLSLVVEAALFASPEPLSLKSLSLLFDEEVTEELIASILDDIRVFYQERGVELVETAGGWRFQTPTRFQSYLNRLRQTKTPKYSRAVMETLAVVVYRQPVTRGDIESIRGVSVSSQVIKTLEDRGWIAVKGYRETIGRPALYVTTTQFLDDFGLKKLSELPNLETFGPTLEVPNDLSSEEKDISLIETAPACT